MAWEEELFAVFDDLEGRAEALYEVERIIEHADRSRSEYASVSLASRLMASMAQPITVYLLGLGPLTGEIRRLGADWFHFHGNEQDWLIRREAVGAVQGASGRSVPEVAWSPVTRLGFGAALRRLAEEEVECVVHLIDGARYDLVVRRVGKDFLEGSLGAAGQGSGPMLLNYPAIAAVQSRPE